MEREKEREREFGRLGLGWKRSVGWWTAASAQWWHWFTLRVCGWRARSQLCRRRCAAPGRPAHNAWPLSSSRFIIHRRRRRRAQPTLERLTLLGLPQPPKDVPLLSRWSPEWENPDTYGSGASAGISKGGKQTGTWGGAAGSERPRTKCWFGVDAERPP